MRTLLVRLGLVFTRNWKVLVAIPAPSLTLTAMSVIPTGPTLGLTVTLRLVPVPPKMMSASLANAWLDEAPVTVRFVDAVSASLTVNGIAGVWVSTAITRLEMAEIVGNRLTVTVKVRETELLLAPTS
jgi:hypothetical protein